MNMHEKMFGIKNSLKKVPVAVGITLASFSNINAQENNTISKEDPKSISVDSAKTIPGAIFQEDSMVLDIPSIKYPDLNAEYYKNDSNNYNFQVFMDKDGIQKDPDAQIALVKEWKEMSEDGWPEKQAKITYDESQNIELQVERKLAQLDDFIYRDQGAIDSQDSVHGIGSDPQYTKVYEEEIIKCKDMKEKIKSNPEGSRGEESYEYWLDFFQKKQDEARKNLAGDYWLKDLIEKGNDSLK